jgi:uncharacterized protein YegL
MVLFFVVDASGSMEGKKIGAVDQAIREAVPEIGDLNNSSDALIKIAALEFSSGARWLTAGGPVDAEQYNWTPIDAAGTTDFGAMCKTLNEKLSTSGNGFMKEATGSFAPVIFLLSDGDPTDDWQKELNNLKQNGWFKASVKIAIAIGDDANKDVLKEFTGNKETVLEVHNTAILMKMIKKVSVRVSQVNSKRDNAVDPSQGGTDNPKVEEVIEAVQEINEELAEDPNANVREEM